MLLHGCNHGIPICIAKVDNAHKKRKKGSRSRLDQRKTKKENVPPSILTQLSSATLPDQWQVRAATTHNSTEYFRIQDGTTNDMCHVVSSVTIHQNGTWKVLFQGQQIPSANPVISKFPNQITLSDTLLDLILSVNGVFLCPGNSEDRLVKVCKRRKDEKMSGDRGFGQTIGYVDHSNIQGKKIAFIHVYIYS